VAIVAASDRIHQITSEANGFAITASEIQRNALMTRILETDLHPGIVVMPAAIVCAHAHTHDAPDEDDRGDAY
jgi:hypothetical protein